MGKERSTATNQQLPFSSPSLNLIPLVHLPPLYLSSCQKSLYSLHHIDRHLTRTTPWFVHSNIERDSELFPSVSPSSSSLSLPHLVSLLFQFYLRNEKVSHVPLFEFWIVLRDWNFIEIGVARVVLLLRNDVRISSFFLFCNTVCLKVYKYL